MAAVAVLALFAASLVLRSGWVVTPLVRGVASSWETRLEGEFGWGSVRPVGLLSVRVEDVTFVPGSSSIPLVRVDAIELSLSPVRWMAGGDPVERVRVESPRVAVLAETGDRGHVAWGRRLADRLGEGRERPGTAGGRSSSAARLPRIDVVGGFVTVDDTTGRHPSAGARILRLALVPSATQGASPQVRGEVFIEGIGRAQVSGSLTPEGMPRGSLQLVDQRDLFALLPGHHRPSPQATLRLSAIEVSWPPRVVLQGVRAEAMNLPVVGVEAWRLDRLAVDRVVATADAVGWHLELGAVEGTFSGLEGDAPVQVSAGRLFSTWDRGRVGLDVTVVDALRQPLRVQAARTGRSEPLRISVEGDHVSLDGVLPLLPHHAALRAHRALFDGRLDLAWHGDVGILDGAVKARLMDVSVDAPSISSARLERFTVETELAFRVEPGRRHATLEPGRIVVGDVPLEVSGSFTDGADRLQASIDLRVAPMPAQQFVASMPRGLLPVLSEFELEGAFGFDARFVLDSANPSALVAEVRLDHDTLRVARFGPGAPIPALNGRTWTRVLPTFEGGLRTVGPGQPDWVPIRAVPYHLYGAIVAAEDDRFWKHDGFDWRGVRRALETNLASRRLAQGGSTISQQVVKNLFLSHDRTLSRKVEEAFLTWQLEKHVEKARILEIYINICHWGPGVYGIMDASLSYFRHTPGYVTLRESAFLASILPNPAYWGEQYARGIVAPSRRTKMRNILGNMHRAGVFGERAHEHHVGLIRRGIVSARPPSRTLGAIRTPSARADDDPRTGSLYP